MELYSYQQAHFEAVYRALQSNHAALDASDTGTGKTIVALHICKRLGVVPLVVGPKSARGGWERAGAACGVPVEYVTYDKLRGRRLGVEVAPCPRHPETGRPFLGPFIRPRPAETEYLREVYRAKGSSIEWRNSYLIIIFDEVHRCSGNTSLNSKALIAAARQGSKILALSATVAEDPRQMKAIGFALGLHGLSRPAPITYVNFLLRHGCRPGVFGGYDFSTDTAQQAKAFAKLHQNIFPARGARMRRSEIPDFPKTKIEVKYLVDETGKAERAIEKLVLLPTSDLAGRQKLREALEFLRVPLFVDFADDYAPSAKLIYFFNFTDPLHECAEALRKKFGADQVGVIWGQQDSDERRAVLESFQANRLTALVCNVQAGGESANMHDPTGKIDRAVFISPCESGRQMQQLFGRANRAGGAYSQQFITLFANTYEEELGARVSQKLKNIETLNDHDFLIYR